MLDLQSDEPTLEERFDVCDLTSVVSSPFGWKILQISQAQAFHLTDSSSSLNCFPSS